VPVHELPRVVGVVSRILEPHGEVLVVETLRDELGVATWGIISGLARQV